MRAQRLAGRARHPWFPKGRLRALRRARGLGLAGLARAAGLSAYTLRLWERGHGVPLQLPAAARLARALGVTPDELGRHGRPQPGAGAVRRGGRHA